MRVSQLRALVKARKRIQQLDAQEEESSPDLLLSFCPQEQVETYMMSLQVRDDYYSPNLEIPEKNLFRALVSRSLLDLRSPEIHVRNDARAWIFSDKDREFSFRWVMVRIGLEECIDALRVKARVFLRGGENRWLDQLNYAVRGSTLERKEPQES